MSVKLRLKRFGKRGRAAYRIVAIDESKKRQGREIEVIGNYDPSFNPAKINIEVNRASYWIKNGAQSSQTVYHLLKSQKIKS